MYSSKHSPIGLVTIFTLRICWGSFSYYLINNLSDNLLEKFFYGVCFIDNYTFSQVLSQFLSS